MPKVTPRPGEVVEQVIQTRTIPPDEQEKIDKDPRDCIEYMAALPAEEYPNHIVYIYRIHPPNEGGYIRKVQPPFDEDYLRENFGGGTYKLMIKRGSERKRVSDVRITGIPKDPDTASTTVKTNGTGATSSDVVQLAELLTKTNPAAMNAEIMKATFLNALQLNREAMAGSITNPKDMIELFLRMQEQNKSNGNHSSEMPSWLQQILTALIPAGVALVTKVLTPVDAAAELAKVQSIMTVAKNLGSEAPSKPDLGVEIVRNGPGLLSEFSKLMAEMRMATVMRMQAERRPATAASMTTAQAPTPGIPQNVPTAAANAIPTGGTGAPSQEWVLNHLASLVERGEPGGYVLAQIAEFDANFVEEMKPLSIDQIREVVLRIPGLMRLKDHPRLGPCIAEIYAALHEGDAVVPQSQAMPN